MSAAAPLASFPLGWRALVVGASGAIGAALVAQLRADPGCAEVLALHRQSQPPMDFNDEAGLAASAAQLAEHVRAHGAFHLIINAAGLLHSEAFAPEKKLGDLNLAQMEATFRANAFGPALLLRHLTPLLDRQRGVFALLSAKVGSIGDNRLGGWYSYRASKAALNMLVKTASIELRRSQPHAVLVALHPGTVSSALSRPFRGDQIGRAPAVAAAELLGVLDRLQPVDSGTFRSWDGQHLPW
ncbi:MAG: SDR family NAD(P)-dependent oxidoreductase [Leptothrix sp. (in: b-proteobacteria)]